MSSECDGLLLFLLIESESALYKRMNDVDDMQLLWRSFKYFRMKS